MHRDLRGFLLTVWDTATKAGGTFDLIEKENGRRSNANRAEILRWMVYAVYNKAGARAPGLDPGEVPGWLARASRLGAQLTIRLQVGDRLKDFAAAYEAYVTRRDSSEEDEAALKAGYIHYVDESSPYPDPRVRVYVNPDPRHALDVLGHLLEGAGTGLFTSCKVAGPLALGTRSDGLLVYCGTRGAAKGVVGVLKSAPRDWFNPETPDLTEKVEDPDFGAGIAIAEEPPHPPPAAAGPHNGARRSFGSLRSEIIAAALLESAGHAKTTHVGRDFTRFEDAVAAGFRGCGLDPDNPAWNLPE